MTTALPTSTRLVTPGHLRWPAAGWFVAWLPPPGAVAHPRAVSGVGEGIYVSHLFTLLWSADVAYGWLRPDRYAGRSPWFGRLLHGFMAFVIFNATVVYETGPIRWAGVLLFAE